MLLWKALKSGAPELHFRKQHPVGPYVLDFYCDAAKLAVEVDGHAHGTEDRPGRDERRDAWLADRGVRTLRIAAREVLRSPGDAVLTIQSFIEEEPL